ncbi:hypothetical protein RUM44_004872 [Polyplax serrata]|uniref:Uncharacterized protein n=1 Tax=Polyplax serrata TaxID=468196 RepID=A0ABR1B4S6_POLSC
MASQWKDTSVITHDYQPKELPVHGEQQQQQQQKVFTEVRYEENKKIEEDTREEVAEEGRKEGKEAEKVVNDTDGNIRRYSCDGTD